MSMLFTHRWATLRVSELKTTPRLRTCWVILFILCTEFPPNRLIENTQCVTVINMEPSLIWTSFLSPITLQLIERAAGFFKNRGLLFLSPYKFFFTYFPPWLHNVCHQGQGKVIKKQFSASVQIQPSHFSWPSPSLELSMSLLLIM